MNIAKHSTAHSAKHSATKAVKDFVKDSVKEPIKMYLLVRTDLKMKAGKIAAQCGHAVEHLCISGRRSTLDEYRNNGHAKIVCKVPNLETLENIERECARQCLPHYKVIDSGKTQIPEGSITVLGVGPIIGSEIPACIAELSLL